MPCQSEMKNVRSMNSSDKKHNLNFSIFKGFASMTLWATEGSRTPLHKVTFNKHMAVALEHNLSLIMNEPPNSKLNILISKYDPQEKKANLETIIIVGKDDAQKYYIEISSPKFTPPVRCYINYQFGLNIGDNPMTDSDRANFALKEFIDFIKPSGEFCRYIEICRNVAAGEEPIYSNKGSSGGGSSSASVAAPSSDPLMDLSL